MIPDESLLKIHKRLLDGDPVASAELAEAVFQPLLGRLRSRFRNVPDGDFIDESAADALIEYLKSPSRFDPAKSSLFGFLSMAGSRNVQNALAKISRRRRQEFSLMGVVELASVGNNPIEEELDHRVMREAIRTEVSGLLDSTETEVFELMVEGVRSTKEYARVLGIQEVDIDRQRREVKRCKDRIKKRLQRKGVWGNAK